MDQFQERRFYQPKSPNHYDLGQILVGFMLSVIAGAQRFAHANQFRGGKVGEVTRIGIRASVIRTANGSEVIVPNGSLISSQVTNWTFSDRQRAVEFSVNVVGGADPQRVVELLKTTAAAHAGVTKEPSPQVYVTNFSSGAVTLQLRAWTDRHEDWAQLRSDLSVAVNDALAREKIAIA